MPSISRYINVISRCGNMYRNERLKGTDLGTSHHTYLFTICRNPGISQEKLARMIYINKSNVTRQLSALEQNGFISRRCSPEDRRIMQVFPTEKAEALYPKVVELMKHWNRLLLEDFSEEEQNLLLDMMQRVQAKAALLAEEEEQKR